MECLICILKRQIPKHFRQIGYFPACSRGLVNSNCIWNGPRKICKYPLSVFLNLKNKRWRILPPLPKRKKERGLKRPNTSCTLGIVNGLPFSPPAPHTAAEYKRPPSVRAITTGGLFICPAAATCHNEAISGRCVVAHSRMRARQCVQRTNALHVTIYCFSLYRHMHEPVPKASQLMSSFHPPVPGRSREGDESSVPIWIFKLFTGTQQKGKQRDGWIPGVFWFQSARHYCLKGPGRAACFGFIRRRQKRQIVVQKKKKKN